MHVEYEKKKEEDDQLFMLVCAQRMKPDFSVFI